MNSTQKGNGSNYSQGKLFPDGIPGATKLVNYGIQNEESDIRIHVSPVTKRAYVYDTNAGIEAIEEGIKLGNIHRKVPVFTWVNNNGYKDKIQTAEGYLIPAKDIYNCKTIVIPEDILSHARFNHKDTTTDKGKKAVFVVKRMLNRALIPLTPNTVEEVDDIDMQINGLDICIASRAKIQVKCDYKAGPIEYGGSGNLFLQISECNPLRQY